MITEESIKKNLELFSFPRLSGTESEKKASELLKERISTLNITPSVQNFSFSTFYSRIYPKIAFFLIYFVLLIFSLNIVLDLIYYAIIVMTLIILSLINRNPENLKIGRILQSRNIYVKFSKENTNKDIIIFAHLDSKAQRFPVKIRILSFRLWFFSFSSGLIIFFLRIFVFIQYSSWLFLIGVVFLVVNSFATLIIILNTTNNKSPGAVDNASGVICVFELLKYFSDPKKRLKNFNLCFVFTGAEECGTMGIRHFYNDIKHLDKENSYIINFDAIGRDLTYWSSYINANKNQLLYNIFLKIANELDLKFKFASNSFGIRSDGLYLRSKNFHGFGFGGVKSVGEYVHTINDTIDKVDTNLIAKLCKFITNALEEIDNLN